MSVAIFCLIDGVLTTHFSKLAFQKVLPREVATDLTTASVDVNARLSMIRLDHVSSQDAIKRIYLVGLIHIHTDTD